MSMDGYLRPNLQRIEHPLGGILSCRPQVEVHPQARGFRCFLMEILQQIFINQLYIHRVNSLARPGIPHGDDSISS